MAKEQNRKKLVLLDTHAILHRAYHALPDFASSKGEATGALYGLSLMIMNIIDKLHPDYIVACYDLPQPTHRHEVYKEYKAGRKKADPELISQIKRSRDVFHAWGIPEYDKPGFEADDMLGTIVEQVKEKYPDVDIIIASGDMDTLQLIEGKRIQVYTPKKGIKETTLYDEDGVKERFGFEPKLLVDYKGLRGDTSDNIIGISGIGEKTATDLILKFGDLDNIYRKLKKNRKEFKDAGFKDRVIELLEKGEDEAMFSKVLATIRRDAPIDFVLPEKNWREAVNVEETENLYRDLEFRSLIDRVKAFVKGEPAPKSAKKSSKDSEGIESPDGITSANVDISAISTADFKRLQIGAWLLDSNYTNPTAEDILKITATENIKEAERVINEEIKTRGISKVYEDIEIPLIPVVEVMEKNGVKVDTEYLKKLGEEYHAEIKNLEKKIWEMAGVEFNIASPKQLGEVLFDKMMLGGTKVKKTATGAKSTKESELQKMKDSHPIISLILDHRELSKLVNTYIDTLPTLVTLDGRIHAHFEQTGTTTGRMSSSNPNLQNIPIKSEAGRKIRNAFIAEKGFKIVSLDYSQIEIRVAAFLSEDENMLEIFREDRDVHTEVAARVFKIPASEVTKEMRNKAKVINFGVMYGMGVNALKQNIGGDRKAAQEFYNNYFETFNGLANYLEKVKAETARTGYAVTLFGRRRYFEGINSKVPFIRAMSERMAINAPIQGTEADIVKLAMVKIYEYLVKEKLSDDVKILMQVHDELVLEVKENIAEKIAKEIKDIMENTVSKDLTKGVVCKAEYEIGNSWGEM